MSSSKSWWKWGEEEDILVEKSIWDEGLAVVLPEAEAEASPSVAATRSGTSKTTDWINDAHARSCRKRRTLSVTPQEVANDNFDEMNVVGVQEVVAALSVQQRKGSAESGCFVLQNVESCKELRQIAATLLQQQRQVNPSQQQQPGETIKPSCKSSTKSSNTSALLVRGIKGAYSAISRTLINWGEDDDDDVFDEHVHANELDDAAVAEHTTAFLIDPGMPVYNRRVLLECCRDILELAQRQGSEDDCCFVLSRRRGSGHSFPAFLAQATSTSNNNRERANVDGDGDDVGESNNNLLANLSPSELDILTHILVEAGFARLHDDEKELLVLCPNGGLLDVDTDDQLDVSIQHPLTLFRLQQTLKQLEARLESLHTHAERQTKQALQEKSSSFPKKAVLSMKRRKILLDQIENTSQQVLNVEAALHTLEGARVNAQVLETLQQATLSIKSVNESASIELVEDTMLEFQEQLDQSQVLQEMIFTSNNENGQQDELGMKELEEELAALELGVADELNQDKETDEKENEKIELSAKASSPTEAQSPAKVEQLPNSSVNDKKDDEAQPSLPVMESL